MTSSGKLVNLSRRYSYHPHLFRSFLWGLSLGGWRAPFPHTLLWSHLLQMWSWWGAINESKTPVSPCSVCIRVSSNVVWAALALTVMPVVAHTRPCGYLHRHIHHLLLCLWGHIIRWHLLVSWLTWVAGIRTLPMGCWDKILNVQSHKLFSCRWYHTVD